MSNNNKNVSKGIKDTAGAAFHGIHNALEKTENAAMNAVDATANAIDNAIDNLTDDQNK
jgi:hypothetical protein